MPKSSDLRKKVLAIFFELVHLPHHQIKPTEVHFHMAHTTTNRTQRKGSSASMPWCVKGYQAQGGQLRREDSAKHGLPTSIPAFTINLEVGS